MSWNGNLSLTKNSHYFKMLTILVPYALARAKGIDEDMSALLNTVPADLSQQLSTHIQQFYNPTQI